MRVILLNDLRQKGKRGQEVEVKPGFARNYLLPQGHAVEATDANRKWFVSQKKKIDAKIAGYGSPVDFYVDRLAEGIATITASVAPNPVIVRLSDFKSNEYSNLLGGARYEPHEENPMLGFRGASRYVAPA